MSNLIKWTGSKTSQSKTIVDLFPKNVHTYYEPFIGGGSVLFEVLDRCEMKQISVQRFCCSDKNSDLINIYNIIKNNPNTLLSVYRQCWDELYNSLDKESVYYKYRDKYNNIILPTEYRACLFYWLSRTCFNGLIRYNKDGKFNTAFHHNRNGMKPIKIENIIMKYHKLFNKYNVVFSNIEYNNCIPLNNDDIVYLDPPYANTQGIYFADGISQTSFFNWLKNLPCNYYLSYDGKTNYKDMTFDLPKELYDEHLYINSGVSSFHKLNSNNKTEVNESLYIKYKK